MASIISAGTTSATALNMSADTSGVLQLASNNGTVALTVNTSQQVGVGTASPANLFHVSTSTAANTKFEQTSTGANYLTLRSNGADKAFIGLENSSGTGLFGGGTAYGLSLGTTGAAGIAFAVNNSVVSRFDSSGIFSTGNQICIGGMYTYGNGGYFSLGSGGQNYDILVATNWGADDKILIEWSYQWNAGQGGTFGIGSIYQRYDNAATYFIKVAESTSSPIGSCSAYTSGSNLYFRVTSSGGINGYWFVRTSTYLASTLNNF